MTTMDAVPTIGKSIDALHAEIEALHAESLARLNKMAWKCADLAQLCQVLGQELKQRYPTDRRAWMAITVIDSAADDTSRKLALRFACPMFSEELSEALEKVGGR